MKPEFEHMPLGILAAALGILAALRSKKKVSGVGVVYFNKQLAIDNDGNGTDEMFPIRLKDLKDGFFKLRPTDSAPVYVRKEYDRSERKWHCEEYDGYREKYLDGNTIVYHGFYF